MNAQPKTIAVTVGESPCASGVPANDSLDFSRVAQMHGASLYRYACHATRHHAEACDLLQDTYERGLRAAPAGLSEQQSLGWMLVVMRNLRLDAFRRRARRPQIFAVAPDQLAVAERRALKSEPFAGRDVAHPDAQQEAPPWEKLDSEDLRRAVGQLSPRLREVYELHAFQALSYVDIAARLRVPVPTVGTRLHRARQKLKELLSRNRSC